MTCTALLMSSFLFSLVHYGSTLQLIQHAKTLLICLLKHTISSVLVIHILIVLIERGQLLQVIKTECIQGVYMQLL